MSSAQRNPDLDGLRGVAILLVLLDHGFGQLIPRAINGWVGVDIFFVLSGFLITTILLGLRTGAGYYAPFYRRRTLRIFPAFYLVLAVDLLISVATGHLGHPAVWLISATFLTSVLQLHFFSAAASLTPAVFWNLQALWSVSLEELFYLLWAPVVKLLSARMLAFTCAGIVLVEPFVRYMLFLAHYPVYSAFAARLDGLAVGAGIAVYGLHRAHRGGLRKQTANLLLGAALLADILAFPYLHLRLFTLPFHLAGYSLIALSTGAAVLWLLSRVGERSFPQRLLGFRLLQLAGRRSYFLYLINQLFFVPANSWARSSISSAPLRFAIALVCVMACFGAAELSWRLLEEPILRAGQRTGAAQPPGAALIQTADSVTPGSEGGSAPAA